LGKLTIEEIICKMSDGRKVTWDRLYKRAPVEKGNVGKVMQKSAWESSNRKKMYGGREI